MEIDVTLSSTSPARGKPALTPESLFTYAKTFGDEFPSEHKVPFPTFRQAAEHFGTTFSKIEDACADYLGDGYLRPAVGFRNHSGFGTFERKGDWLVEAYD